jgi:hypothetical protein
MKVYTAPEEIPAPEIDFRNFDLKRMEAQESEHRAKLKEWLVSKGYTGERTGEVLSEPHADGHAQYMLGHAGRKSMLVHLPYGDAWHSPNVEHLPLKEVIARLDRSKALTALFREAAGVDADGAPAPRM